MPGLSADHHLLLTICFLLFSCCSKSLCVSSLFYAKHWISTYHRGFVWYYFPREVLFFILLAKEELLTPIPRKLIFIVFQWACVLCFLSMWHLRFLPQGLSVLFDLRGRTWGCVWVWGYVSLRLCQPFSTTFNSDMFLEYEYGFGHECDAHTLLMASVFLKYSKMMRISFFLLRSF